MVELWRKLRFLLNRPRLDRELAEEMQFHLEQKARETADPLVIRDLLLSHGQRIPGGREILGSVQPFGP